ncbi:MAG: CRTAC1 family protein, partial [Saprospiraceae bacterium]|nr:CRTAC1 family protein [Saprospiraceae bacterium]
MKKLLFAILVSGILCSCRETETSSTHQEEQVNQFTLLSSEKTGIAFSNQLQPDYDLGPVGFDYYYNGAGVAIGDIDNDGLQDIYFTSNTNGDRLYKNSGKMKFRDISAQAGIRIDSSWHNGVTMVDINSDGYLDIYVSVSGHRNDPENRKNLLFVNQDGERFVEMAEEFNLDHDGYSTQSYFFDADRDGDLDVLILNRPDRWVSEDSEFDRMKAVADKVHKDRFLLNDGQVFRDVSESSGFEDNFAFSLSASIEDYNNDGWLDIYVANDYLQSDYYYENQRDGTFKEKITSFSNHVPYYAMGSDFKDLNNDGYVDGMVVEMLPDDYVRAKTTMLPMMHPLAFESVMGPKYHYQYMHNVLYCNMRNAFFSDISYYSGVTSTDWSWAVLLNDLDNDGLKDIYITNGYRYDFNDRDIIKKWHQALVSVIDRNKVDLQNSEFMDIFNSNNLVEDPPPFEELLQIVPTNKLTNLVYKNMGGFKFSGTTTTWNMDQPEFSTGAAIGDLDNDGDLDVVVNNIDSEAFIYQNDLDQGDHIRVQLMDGKKLAWGAEIRCYAGKEVLTERLFPTRGYLSSSEPVIHIGLGQRQVDSIVAFWNGSKCNVIPNPELNKKISLDMTCSDVPGIADQKSTFISDVTSEVLRTEIIHSENEYFDYKKQVLLPHKLSQEGPALAVADVNGDELQDFYFGGALGYPGQLYVQTASGEFKFSPQRAFITDE